MQRFALLLTLALCGCDPHVRSPRLQTAHARAERGQPDYWPTNGWREATPESQGVSSAALAAAMDTIAARRIAIHSLLVIRNGRILLDASFFPFAPEKRHDIASVTKSVTSIVVGAAELDGHLRAGDTLLRVLRVNPRRMDERKLRITIGDLLAMRSGFDCAPEGGEPQLEAMKRSTDWIAFALALPMSNAPGTEGKYCSPNYHLAAAAIAAATGQPMHVYAREKLFDPLGIQDVNWPVDPKGIAHGWGDLQLLPRDLAKLGFLYMHGGKWEKKQIVSPEWVERSLRVRTTWGTDLYSFGWWTHRNAPNGFFEAIGRGGQRLSVLPNENIIVVMTGGGFEPGLVGSLLKGAVVSDTPLAERPDVFDQLRDRVRLAAMPPTAKETVLPAKALTVSGARYALDENRLGLDAITLEFAGAQARALLELKDRVLDLRVGLDGVLRPSNSVVDGIHPWSRGQWTNSDEFLLELNLAGKIDRYALAMRFDSDTLVLTLSEATRRGSQTITGRRVSVPGARTRS